MDARILREAIGRIMPSVHPTAAALLAAAYRHVIDEPNIEAGYERFRTITGGEVDFQAFCDAVAACLREGLIHEPIRLPEGALQCHWHLELTPKGVEVVSIDLHKPGWENG